MDRWRNCPTQSGKYKYGTVLGLAGVPASDYAFDYWSGDVPPEQDSATSRLSVTMNGNKSLTGDISRAVTNRCWDLTSVRIAKRCGSTVSAFLGFCDCQGGSQYNPNTPGVGRQPGDGLCLQGMDGDATGSSQSRRVLHGCRQDG